MTDLQTVLMGIAESFEAKANQARDSYTRTRNEAETAIIQGDLIKVSNCTTFAQKYFDQFETFREVARILKDKVGPC